MKLLRKRHRSHPDLNGPARARAIDALTDHQASLDAAMKSTESEFMQLGRQMETMSGLTHDIARLAREVLEATSGGCEGGALAQATSTFEKIFTFAEAKQFHVTKIRGRLHDIGERITVNLKARMDLERVLAVFGPLAMGFRIEIARLAADDAMQFQALAEAITATQKLANGSAERYFTGMADMLKFMERMRIRFDEYSGRFTRDLSGARQSVSEHLAALRQRWAEAADASAAADGMARNIGAEIGKIVVATQYQDIAHQQIEHIADALAEIRLQFQEPGGVGQKDASDLLSFARHAGLVQCQQMDSVADEVGRASETILAGMNSILESAGRLVGSQSEGESPNDDLVAGFRNDVSFMTELDAAGSAASDELAAWIEPAVKMLSTISGEMSRYSNQIRVTAINAQIEAGRNSRGKVLEVLASELSVAASRSRAVIDQMSTFLAEVMRDLGGDLDQSRVAAVADGDELREAARRVTELLGQVQSDVRHKSSELTSLYTKLTNDTQATVSGTDLHGTVVAPVLRVKAEIKEWIDSFELDESQVGSTESARLAALRQSYTMESERIAHDRVAGTIKKKTADPTHSPSVAPPEPSLAVASPAAGAVEDNVELF